MAPVAKCYKELSENSLIKPMSEKSLIVENLVYGGFGPVSFNLVAGECIGIFGESGCGKTRLLRSIADLDPHQGSLSFNDEDALSMPASTWRRRVAFLPSESQWWRDRVSEHFPLPPGEPELGSLALQPKILSAEVSHLSSGEKQRLALLRALKNSPAVLLLDEITAHLDSERAQLTEKKIAALQSEQNLAVVWVSHNIDQLRRVCSRILYMAQGGTIVKEELVK